MAILGLVGFIGAGKGTVGDLLVKKGYAKDSFAKPLKDAVSIIFGWPREMLEGDTPMSRSWREKPDAYWSEKFGYELSPRLALQLMGTEAGRNVFHNDIWVVSLLNRARDKDVVVTDVRFMNEVDYIQKNGGKIIKVSRGKNPDWFDELMMIKDPIERTAFMQPLGVHQSEWDWVGCQLDYNICNDGTLEDLSDEVDFFFPTK